MRYFLQTEERVRIINGEHEFECTPARFQELEPDYIGLPPGCVTRYWTPDRAYLVEIVCGADITIAYDGHDCGQYCEQVSQYTAYPEIYIHVSLSQTALDISQNEQINFVAVFRPSDNPDDPPLPVSDAWLIKLRHEDGVSFDRFLAQFIDGSCSANYTYHQGTPLGEWRLHEEDFDLVEFAGATYQVRLANPVSFTMYREL